MKSNYLKFVLLSVLIAVIALSFFLTDSSAADGWIGETKIALKKVHEKVGKLPKGRQAKFGNSQRGDSSKGYRLDAGHPNRPVDHPSCGAHINYWDYTGSEGRKSGFYGTEPLNCESNGEPIADSAKTITFESVYSKEELTSYRKLSPEECLDIKAVLIDKLGLSDDISSLDLVKYIAQGSAFIPDINIENADFNLVNLLSSHDVKPDEKLFINWYRYDDIDEISLEDLSNHIKDIWHPKADDVDIFDISMKWILSIDHDGFVSLFLLN